MIPLHVAKLRLPRGKTTVFTTILQIYVQPSIPPLGQSLLGVGPGLPAYKNLTVSPPSPTPCPPYLLLLPACLGFQPVQKPLPDVKTFDCTVSTLSMLANSALHVLTRNFVA
jgi:hypothetical protein